MAWTESQAQRFASPDFGLDPYFKRVAGRAECSEKHLEYMFRIMWPFLAQIRKFIVSQKAMTSYSAIASVAPGDRDGEFIGPGHILYVDFPGKGKTLLGKIPAIVLGGTFARFQGAVDNLPADYLGHRYPDFDDKGKRVYKLEEGPAFADIQLHDEANRNTDKTQGAILPVIAEGKIIIAGEKNEHKIIPWAIFTMNQIESEGVYPIIEALADRIMFKIRGDWFTAKHFAEIAERSAHFDELRRGLKRVCGISTVHEIREFVLKKIYIDPNLEENRMGRFAEISNNPQRFGYLKWYSNQFGGGPLIQSGMWGRAFTHWVGAAKALAMFRYRDYVVGDDARKILPPILRHRMVFAPGVVRRFKKIFGHTDENETIDRIILDLIKEAF